jgi:anti-sigma factor ChrR (cupin superfamily)
MHLNEQQINDYLDGELSSAAASSVTTHIQECEACRAEVDALRHLLARVGQLPRDIQPERDLRPAVWQQAERRTLWHWRYPLAAAAVLLIAISSTLTVLLTRGADGPVVRVTESADPVDLVSLETRYTSELADLQRTLREQRDRLSPQTVRILEENLAIIDRAIAEARAALVNDPQSDMLGELLRSAYQRKIDLLKQAARSSAET